MVPLVYSSRYAIDIGAHVFPTRKYGMVHARLLEHRPVVASEPEAASWDDLRLVHTPTYLQKVRTGALSLTEQAQLEVPWSHAITDGFRLMTGGTVTAARVALRAGGAVHLGGGFHHAFPDHGEGFCMFNDVGLAIRVLQRDAAIQRSAIIDCDVHHGNGTAALFRADQRVFTFSMHQEDNYPLDKPASTLDIGLAAGTEDIEYLQRLEEALPVVLAHEPDLLFYLAGADPYVDDQLGGLALTENGLRERDRLVLQQARVAGIPVVVTLAGGYASDVNDTVAIHVATVEESLRLLGSRLG